MDVIAQSTNYDYLFISCRVSNLNKLDYVTLEVSERNYPKWTQDVKLHLTAKKMRPTINADNIAAEVLKATAIIFIRKHIEEAFQVEFLAMKERFNH